MDNGESRVNLVKLKNAASLYGFEYYTLYNLVKANFKDINQCVYKIGGRFYLDKALFENWLKSQRNPT
jgi:hypothetical protein